MPSLLDYADDPLVVPSPLPPQHHRRRRHGSDHDFTRLDWPVGILPAEPIALDAAHRGLTYRHGVGYALHGDRYERTQVAHLIADVLDHAARSLRPWAVSSAEVEDTLLEEARGLEATAHQIRISAPTQTNLLHLVRPHLPSPATRDDGAASGFLATFDGEPPMLRSRLASGYVEAGSPGDLTKTELLGLAADRWGAPRKTGGQYVFSTASRARSVRADESDSDIAAFAARHRVDPDALAEFLASYSTRHGGEPAP